MKPLSQFGVSAWSWLNTLGEDHYEFRKTGTRTSGSLREKLEVEGLFDHEERLHIPGYSGFAKGELPPLPSQLAHHDSRCARLVAKCLAPISESVEAALQKYGKDRVAIVLGSSTSGIDATESALRHHRKTGVLPADYQFGETHAYDALLRLIANLYGITGPAYVVSTACSSGGKAIAAATRLLHTDRVDAVLTGGADGLCELTIRGFSGLGVLSDERCRPFDKTRSGISIGEGAALLLMERETDSPYSVLGVGESGDAHHATAPHPEGLGAKLALERCLELSSLTPGDVDYLNAHGTGTEKNDSMESIAIQAVLAGVPFSSTKHGTGHQLGAAGGTEAVFSLQALAENFLPKNRAPIEVDTELASQPLSEVKEAPNSKVIVSNSFAFGGSNVSVALGRTETRLSKPQAGAKTFYVRGHALWAPTRKDAATWISRETTELTEKPPAAILPARTRGRASILTRMYAELYEMLRGDADAPRFEASEIASIYSSAYGEMSTTLKLLDQMADEPKLSPIRFQSSVHNTASGQLSLVTKNRNFTTAIASGQTSFAMGLLEAMAFLASHGGEILTFTADEEAAARLMPAPHFAHLGIGLHLSSVAPADDSHLGTLTWIETTRVTCSLSGECPEELGGSPAAWGLDLIDALNGVEARRVAVGPGYELFVEPNRK